jgi:purine-binding chemotaxis protein CheW
MGMMERIDSNETGREYLSFRLGGEEYGIEIMGVREIRAYQVPTRIAGAPAYVRGVIDLRGTIVPIVDLRVRFGMPPAANEASSVVVIVIIDEQLVGVMVDGVSDVLALTADQVRPAPELASRVGASTIRGLASIADRLLILLDIGASVALDPSAVADVAAVGA